MNGKPLKAMERNKALYNALIEVSESGYTGLEQFVPGMAEASKVRERLLKLKYVHPKESISTQNTDIEYQITDDGWKFLESYEKYEERVRTNTLLLIIGIPAAIYYIFGIIEMICSVFKNLTCY